LPEEETKEETVKNILAKIAVILRGKINAGPCPAEQQCAKTFNA